MARQLYNGPVTFLNTVRIDLLLWASFGQLFCVSLVLVEQSLSVSIQVFSCPHLLSSQIGLSYLLTLEAEL